MNSIPVSVARDATGEVPPGVKWLVSVKQDLPDFLLQLLDAGLAEGVAWKLAPLRAFPDDYELAFDNDVILWSVPSAIEQWLAGACDVLLAEDVSRCFGAFDGLCPGRPVNSGIRGLPPRFNLAAALRPLLEARRELLLREGDEQGLQVAALARAGRLGLVSADDVTICSPFPPHTPHLGRAGAHFVGLNTRRLGFQFNGRPAEQIRAEHWDQCVGELAARVGRAAVS